MDLIIFMFHNFFRTVEQDITELSLDVTLVDVCPVIVMDIQMIVIPTLDIAW